MVLQVLLLDHVPRSLFVSAAPKPGRCPVFNQVEQGGQKDPCLLEPGTGLRGASALIPLRSEHAADTGLYPTWREFQPPKWKTRQCREVGVGILVFLARNIPKFCFLGGT